MPSTSKKQHNFMAAIANSPAFSKKVGIPQSVGKDFTAADKGRKFRTGGRPAINKQDTQHGSMDMPFKSVRKFAGMKSGGKVKKFEDGGEAITKSDYLNRERTESDLAEKAAQPSAAKPKIYTKETLVKAGFAPTDLRGYLNYMKTKTGSMAASQRVADDFEKSRGEKDLLDNAISMGNEAKRVGMTKATIPLDNEGRRAGRTSAPIPLGNEGRRLGGYKAGGNVKYNFEKSGKDVEKKGMKEGSKADMALDKKQMMKMGGMAGMHKMPDGKMMKNSAMKMGGMPMKDGKPAFMMGKKKMMGGGMSGYAKGGGIESSGKTKGTVIRMASGGSVSSASRRADGIAQRGKTRC